jgi:hypothetical protein
LTGWLAAAGVVLVVLAATYSGLTAGGIEGVDDHLNVTPVTDADSSRDREPAESAETTATPPAEIPLVTPTPENVTNRQNCDQIRGTDYFSPEERSWYLSNCTRN